MKTPALILLQLKTLGPYSVKMLALRLGITPMGIRQHLQSLEQRELVCYEEARSKVDRPARYCSLTPLRARTICHRHAGWHRHCAYLIQPREL